MYPFVTNSSTSASIADCIKVKNPASKSKQILTNGLVLYLQYSPVYSSYPDPVFLTFYDYHRRCHVYNHAAGLCFMGIYFSFTAVYMYFV